MKVLDLQCTRNHLFEGWFTSEDDFTAQKKSGMLVCPLCGDSTVHKRLSAPRLNLRSRASDSMPVRDDLSPDESALALQSAWMKTARRVLATTEDVGDQFAQEARKIHHGEVPVRGIRGQATLAEAVSLIDEGIAVLPLPLTEAIKQPLQ